MNGIYETDLKFTPIVDKDFIPKRMTPITVILSIAFSIAIIIFLLYEDCLDIESLILSIIVGMLSGLLFAVLLTLKENLYLQKQKKFLHNKNIEYVQKNTDDILSRNGLGDKSKKLSIFYKDAELRNFENLNNDFRIILGSMKAPEKKREVFYDDKFAINTENATFGYLRYEINEETGEEKYNINTAKFGEVIDFELVDKTTSTQISLAKSSSNSSDAIAGAAVSEFLFNDAATGAIIGASSDVTTETVTQTLKDELYQINIQLDNIENPIIKIETKNRETVSQIIAMLKIIMNKSKVKES